MIRYIENIDISLSISIYCIVSYRIVEKNINITIFSMYRDISCQKFTFLLLHKQNNKNKQRQ